MKVIDIMHVNFLKKTQELRKKLPEKNLTLEEWVTIASMIEKETAKPEEKPLVSAVIYNRIKKRDETPDRPNRYICVKKKRLVEG